MMKAAAIAMLLFFGATQEEAEKLSQHHTWQNAAVLVTRTDVRKLGQVEVLGYFPNAVFFYKNSLKPNQGSLQGPAHLSLDVSQIVKKRDFSNVLPVNFTFYESNPQKTITWHLPAKDVASFFNRNGLKIDSTLKAMSFNDGRIIVKELDKETGYNPFFLMPEKSTEEWPQTSIMVEVGTQKSITNRLMEFLPGLSQEDRTRLGLPEYKAENGEEWKKAWAAGKQAFALHYEMMWLTGKVSYEGPDGVRPATPMADLGAPVHRLTAKGSVVMPSLELPADEDSLPPNSREHRPARILLSEKSDQKLSAIEIDGTQLLQQIVGPSLIPKVKDASQLKCSLIKSEDGQEIAQSGACRRDGEIYKIRIRKDNRNPENNRFYVTDDTEVPSWRFQVELLENEPETTQLVGEFYPIQFAKDEK